jgi:nitrate reductase NapE component
MADETTTGAAKEITISNDAIKEDKRKKIIKYAVIAVIVIAVGFIVWKFILKK